jgi:ribosomal protein S18 acetylase RimI-like enzyme
MVIRSWYKKDLDEIISLLKQMDEDPDEVQNISKSNVMKHYKEMEAKKDIYENYVVEQEGKIIGYMSLLFYRSLYHNSGTAQVNELIIDKEYRGRGLGKELLRYGIKRAEERNMDEIEIGVEKKNKRAIMFYKGNGIEEEYLLLGKEFNRYRE